MTHNRRIRVEVTCPDADPHIPQRGRDLPDQRLARARDLRLLRHRLRRPPGAHPHPDARRLAGPPAAQGLPARRHPGRVQGRHHPAARPAGGRTTDDRPTRRTTPYAATESEHQPRAGSSPSPARTGTRVVDGHRRRGRRPGRRQHGPAAPVDPRRAPADPRARGRDGHRGPLRHRLPAHRHREEHGVPLLGAGRHVLHPDGLPVPVLQRDDLLPRRRAAARHRGRHPGEGPGHAGPADGAQPDLLPPGLHRHRRHGDRRADRDDDRLPRARAGARPVRADHRPADEPRVHPPRRRRPGHAARRARPDPRLHRADEEAPARSTPPSATPTRSSRPASSTSATSTSPAAWRSASPARCCARPATPGTCARRQPYCGYEDYDFDVQHLGHLRRLRPVPDPPRRDVGVAAHRRAVRRRGSPASRARR